MENSHEEIEIPNYFICPISLEMMRDPVITLSGITYDRQSINKWLSSVTGNVAVVFCPVTKQPLSIDSDLIPNHMLRRLIQYWCVENETRGVVRIPTPRAPPPKPDLLHEIKNLKKLGGDVLKTGDTVKKLEVLALESESNRRIMLEENIHKSLILFLVKCFEQKRHRFEGFEESLRLLHLVGVPSQDARTLLLENDQILESLAWILRNESDNQIIIKAYAIILFRVLTENTSSHILERLNPEFFKGIIEFLKDLNQNPNLRLTVPSPSTNVGVTLPTSQHDFFAVKQAMTAALKILLKTSSWSRNRASIVELGAVFELIELELNPVYSDQKKRTTEFVLGILSRLCCCAAGRAEILAHKGGIAVITKRILRGSPTVDDIALSILSTISKFSPENAVVDEMVTVGTVEKLCSVVRVDCGINLKEKAREILRNHFDEFKKFSCVKISLVTKVLTSTHQDLLNEYYSGVRFQH